MRKIFTVVALVCMVCLLGACDKNEKADVKNPITEYSSLEEINNIVGGKLETPGVMGVTNKTYRIIDNGEFKIAEVGFSVNGIDYTLRNAATTEDISGTYIDGKLAFGEPTNDVDYVFTDSQKLSRWFWIEGQYVLIANDNGILDEETFKSITEELRWLTTNAMSPNEKENLYKELEGDYQDSYSQRASMNVTANGTEGVKIVINWGNSAFETISWEMNAYRSEDGLLSYNDAVKKSVKTDDAGNTSVDILSIDGIGYFEIGENKLLWTGAEEENAKNCVFEKSNCNSVK